MAKGPKKPSGDGRKPDPRSAKDSKPAIRDPKKEAGNSGKKDATGSVLSAPTQQARSALEGNYAAQTLPAITQQAHSAPVGNYAAQILPALNKQGGKVQEENQSDAKDTLEAEGAGKDQDSDLESVESPLNLSFDVKNKIITINEAGEIDLVRLWGGIQDWATSLENLVYKSVMESSGNIELPDGTRSPIIVILKNDWRLAAVDPVWIVGGLLTGRHQSIGEDFSRFYHPVVEEARDLITLMNDTRDEYHDSPGAEGADGGLVGDVKIEFRPTAGLTMAAAAVSAATGDLTVHPSDRIRLSGPAIPVEKVKAQVQNSAHALEALWKEIEALHGYDAAELSGGRNTQEVPLSEDELAMLRTMVEAALALHNAPEVSRPIFDVLANFDEYFKAVTKTMTEAAKAATALAALLVGLTAVVAALGELITSLSALLP